MPRNTGTGMTSWVLLNTSMKHRKGATKDLLNTAKYGKGPDSLDLTLTASGLRTRSILNKFERYLQVQVEF